MTKEGLRYNKPACSPQANEARRRVLINDLLVAAVEAYWQWAYQYQVADIYAQSLALAEKRLQIVVESFAQGDKPAIDTLEATIQVQNRRVQLAQARVELQNSALVLSNYLWYQDLVPLEVTEQLLPEALTLVDPATVLLADSAMVLTNLQRNHPELQGLQIKLRELAIKERWQKEQFKPQLNFQYNFLGNGFDWTADNPDQATWANLFRENYKWGVKFSYPLLLRKARGGLELTRLQQLEAQYKLQDKTLSLRNKIQGLYALYQTTLQQWNLQESMVDNYFSLLAAENEKFRIGESSIFLLNNREQKLIDARLKRNELQMKLRVLRWKLDWAQGRLR